MRRPPAPALLLLLLLLLAALGWAAAHNCTCPTNKWAVCSAAGAECRCTVPGSGRAADCSTLTSKCLLLKARMSPHKPRRLAPPPERAVLDNDGLYDPDCDGLGRFKARQCNGSAECWCVNSAGVRRTDKGGPGLRCGALVRTSAILVRLRHEPRARPFDAAELRRALSALFRERYLLRARCVAAVEYEPPAVHIELRQNASQKARGDVDIADAAYYFERDVKGDSVFGEPRLELRVRGEPLRLQDVLLYYVDDEPPEFSMTRVTAGAAGVAAAVALAGVAGVVVLAVSRRRKAGKYEKVDVKEMGEMRRPAPS